MYKLLFSLFLLITVLSAGCTPIYPGEQLTRRGDEIVVCGQLFHTQTPVVLWTDPGGYDAYRTERHFGPTAVCAPPAMRPAIPTVNSSITF